MAQPRRFVLRVLTAVITGALMGPLASVHAEVPKADKVAALLPEDIRQAGVLRIAVPDIGKPLAYKEGNSLKGMDVDLAHAIAETMGLKADISLIPFAAALTGLQADKFDISFGEFYVTNERLKVVDFVTDWQDYSSFLALKTGKTKLSALTDICGHSVGAMAGSAELETLKTAVPKCGGSAPTVSSFPSISNAVLALHSGRVDGVLINRGGAQEAIHLDDALAATGEIGGGPTATAIARNKNAEKLGKALQAAYDHLIQSGVYASILKANDTAYGAAKSASIYREGSTPPKYGF
ncbi:transporter substrate-binding domain-containing protein [Paraburkholderia lycopersici]|uniref:Polar amino acid transport system substrate-binding protein n=1 Tax=Paraburkholderia lycopersici TaxID=416944 RepID=A0A1G6TGQ1_9BURK|nr:transporter substrate-binding domain-containing protein [Paraburkholderia lycopersici]SDD28250.1 polar amino acid transport system substrate-binding protein [Paraburkholderia lycopersici]